MSSKLNLPLLLGGELNPFMVPMNVKSIKTVNTEPLNDSKNSINSYAPPPKMMTQPTGIKVLVRKNITL